MLYNNHILTELVKYDTENLASKETKDQKNLRQAIDVFIYGQAFAKTCKKISSFLSAGPGIIEVKIFNTQTDKQSRKS